MPLTAAELLDLPSDELDDVYRASSSGPIPAGRGDGTALMAPGTAFGKAAARAARAVACVASELSTPAHRRVVALATLVILRHSPVIFRHR